MRCHLIVGLVGMLCVPFRGEAQTELSISPPTSTTGSVLTLGRYQPLTVLVTAPGGLVTVQWYHEGVAIPGADNRVLWFTPVEARHAGQYHVVATMGGVAYPGPVATFQVTGAPPAVTVSPSGQVAVRQGMPLMLEGASSGTPPHAYQWYRDGARLEGQTNASLRIEEVGESEVGAYQLMATNAFGRASSGLCVVSWVAEAPRWISPPANYVVPEGETLVLRAEAEGGPPPRFRWEHNGRLLVDQTNSRWMQSRVGQAHAGEYVVTAENAWGSIRAAIQVAVRPTHGLDRWTWRLPVPQGSGLSALAFGGDRWVGVGNAGAAVVSTNGTDWESVRFPALAWLKQLLWTGTEFHAFGLLPDYASAWGASAGTVGSARLPGFWVSRDGRSWEPVEGIPTPYGLRQWAYGGGRWVAVTPDPSAFVWVSRDGRRWEAQRAMPYSGMGVVYERGRFVVSDSGGRIHVSEDGETWRVVRKLEDAYPVELHATPSGFLVRYVHHVAHSVDGEVWETQPLLYDSASTALVYGNGVYVRNESSQSHGVVHVSANARDWKAIVVDPSQAVRAVAFDGSRFVGVGEGGLILSSRNGVDWVRVPERGEPDLNALVGSEDGYLAAGDSGALLISETGQRWTRIATPTGRDLVGAAFARGVYVVGGEGGAILSSTNRVDWVRRPSGLAQNIVRIGADDLGFWALSWMGQWSTSSNGTEWVRDERSTNVNAVGATSMARGLGVWVQSSFERSKALRVSADAQNWDFVQISPPPPTSMREVLDVVFGGGRFVAAPARGYCLVSTNGRVWSAHISPEWKRLVYMAGHFFATDEFGRVGVSVDGTSWSLHPSAKSQVLKDLVLTRNGTLLAVGNNGTVLESDDLRPRWRWTRGAAGASGFELEPTPFAGGLSFEGSDDLRTWKPVLREEVRLGSEGRRFFRAVTP